LVTPAQWPRSVVQRIDSGGAGYTDPNNNKTYDQSARGTQANIDYSGGDLESVATGSGVRERHRRLSLSRITQEGWQMQYPSNMTFFNSAVRCRPLVHCSNGLSMSRQHLSALLFWSAILLVLLAGVTLLPYASPRINDFGYHSLCSFAPYSSGTLLLAAGLASVVRAYLKQNV
jgi:hypothetical protein